MASDVTKCMARRGFLRLTVAPTSAAGLVASSPVTGEAHLPLEARSDNGRRAVHQAFQYLNLMMEAHQSGGTTRLVQSYSDQQGLGATAFTYDNALTILAYLVGLTRLGRVCRVDGRGTGVWRRGLWPSSLRTR